LRNKHLNKKRETRKWPREVLGKFKRKNSFYNGGNKKASECKRRRFESRKWRSVREDSVVIVGEVVVGAEREEVGKDAGEM